MPANIVEGQDAEDVASYVASVAGLGDRRRTPAPTPSAEPAPAASAGAQGDAAAGKAVFASAGCGSCHTLADAGVDRRRSARTSTRPSPTPHSSTIAVTNGKGVMPSFKGQLDETQIADVAAYVSSVAGK